MKISRKQYEELCESRCCDSKEDFHKLLEIVTSIKAKPYTGYSYYDEAGNYIGDSNDTCIKDLLDNAYIRIEE